LLSGLTGIALANETLKQQPPLEIPKSLNDLDLSPPVDNVKSAPPSQQRNHPKAKPKPLTNLQPNHQSHLLVI
jgi:hypothetical protein